MPIVITLIMIIDFFLMVSHLKGKLFLSLNCFNYYLYWKGFDYDDDDYDYDDDHLMMMVINYCYFIINTNI